MSISRVFARPMLAAMFISGGLDAARHPETKVEAAKPVTDQLRTVVPSLPEDTATLVRANGMVQVVAGVMLALGKARRLAALALIGSLIPTTWAGHRFWEESDDQKRAQQRVHFLKNVGLLGGLILAMMDTEGAPSLSWRAHRGAKRGAQQVSHVVSLGRASTGSSAHSASVKAGAVGRKAQRKAKVAGRKAGLDARKAAIKANKAAVRGGRRTTRVASGAATSGLAVAAPYIRQAGESAHQVGQAATAAWENAEGSAQRASSKAVASGRKSGRKAQRKARRAVMQANEATKRGGHQAGHQAGQAAHEAAHQVGQGANEAAQQFNEVALQAGRALSDAATSGVALAVPYIRQANEGAHSVVESMAEGVQSVAHALREGAEPALTALRENADPLIAAGVGRAEELRDKVTEHLGK